MRQRQEFRCGIGASVTFFNTSSTFYVQRLKSTSILRRRVLWMKIVIYMNSSMFKNIHWTRTLYCTFTCIWLLPWTCLNTCTWTIGQVLCTRTSLRRTDKCTRTKKQVKKGKPKHVHEHVLIQNIILKSLFVYINISFTENGFFLK